MVSSNDVSRLFLQSMISRRVVSDKLARVLWKKCVEAVEVADEDAEVPFDPNRFDQFINDLNNHLSPLDLKISVTVDEVVAKKLWALVNTKDDELAQVATDCTPVEIAYFKAVVEQIVLAPSESYSISSMAALREVNNLKPSMSKTQAEVVLADFVAKGWLVKSKRSRFCLSPRALLELREYLKSSYEDDIHECAVCSELLTKGFRCYGPACSARLHDHCYKQCVRDNNTCPSCRTHWSQPQKLVTIGEGAVRDGEDSRRRTKRQEEEEEAETEDTNSEEEEPEPKPKPVKKGKAKPTKTMQRVVQEEAEDDGNSEEMEVDDPDANESPAPKGRARRQRR